MIDYPILLSIVLVVRNQAKELRSLLIDTASAVEGLVSDYELIIIDNASDDDSLAVLKSLTVEKRGCQISKCMH